MMDKPLPSRIPKLSDSMERHQEEQQHDDSLLERPFRLKIRFVHDVQEMYGQDSNPPLSPETNHV